MDHIKNHDFTELDNGEKHTGIGDVMPFDRIHHGEGRQETLQVEAAVKFGDRLAVTVLGPVHAVGKKPDGGGVHHINRSLESSCHPTERCVAEVRTDGLEINRAHD